MTPSPAAAQRTPTPTPWSWSWSRYDRRRGWAWRGAPGLAVAVAAGLAFAATAAAAGAARAAPKGRALITAAPDPASDFGRRLAFHRGEADAQAAAVAPGQSLWLGPLPWAASYGALIEKGARIVSQQASVETIPAIPGLAVEVTATLEIVDAGVTSIDLRTELIEVKSLTVQAPPASQATVGYEVWFQQIGRIGIAFASPPPVGSVVTVQLAYTAGLDCGKKTTLLRTCTFDNEFQQVLFFRLFPDLANAAHAPFPSKLHIITPGDRIAAAPGVPLGAVSLDDGRLRWTFDQPERTEHGGFAIADYRIVGSGPDDVPPGQRWLRLLVLPSFQQGAAALRTSVQAVIDFYAERFVAFPWSGLSIIQVANNFGGGYAPLSAIFMLRNVFSAQEGSWGWQSWAELAAHEVAHQWWGNLVRPLGSPSDVSLSESLAEFSSCLFTEQTLQNRSQIIGDNLSYVYTVSAQDDRALASQGVYATPAYVPIVYHKGAVAMDMLRLEIGEKPWLQALAALATKFDRDYARVLDLQAAVEAAAGQPMAWYFDQWFKGVGHIDVELAARVAPVGEGYQLRLRVQQLSGQIFRFRLPLRITMADGEIREEAVDVVPSDGEVATIVTLPLAKRPVLVRPDPTRRLLRYFRVMGGADVSLDGEVDGVDLVEAAFRHGRAIVGPKGQFWPSQSWEELFDATGDHRIDGKDLEHIDAYAGAVMPAF